MHNELSIKSILIDHLLAIEAQEDDVLLAELPFAQSSRRADLVHANGCLHAYEIKSSADKLSRLTQQIPDYEKVFDKVTLVTTDEHLQNARGLLPKKIGIMLVQNGKIKTLRKATDIRRVDKYYLTCFLSKEEILYELKEKQISMDRYYKFYSHDARNLLSQSVNTDFIRIKVLENIKKRYRQRFDTFLQYRGKITAPEDIKLLSSVSETALSDLPAL